MPVCLLHEMLNTVESLEFAVTQFSGVFVGIPPPWILILDETNFELVIYLTEAENRRIDKITSQRKSTKLKTRENWPNELQWCHSKKHSVMIVSRSYWKRNNLQCISIYNTIQLTEPQIRDGFCTCTLS